MENGKWGLKNNLNEEVLPCIYDEIQFIHHFRYNGIFGIKATKIRRSYKVVSASNNYPFPVENTFLVTLEGKHQLVTPEKTIALPIGNYRYPILFSSGDLENQIFIMENDGKFGGFSAQGQLLIPFEYDRIRCYANARIKIEMRNAFEREKKVKKEIKRKLKRQFFTSKHRLPIFFPNSDSSPLSFLPFFQIDTSFPKLRKFQYTMQLSEVSNNVFSSIKSNDFLHIWDETLLIDFELNININGGNFGEKLLPTNLAKTKPLELLYGKIIIAQKKGLWNLIDIKTGQTILIVMILWFE